MIGVELVSRSVRAGAGGERDEAWGSSSSAAWSPVMKRYVRALNSTPRVDLCGAGTDPRPIEVDVGKRAPGPAMSEFTWTHSMQ